MTYDEAKTLLGNAGQAHILEFWDSIDDAGRRHLLDQVELINFDDIAMMKSLLEGCSAEETASDMEPAPVITLAQQDDPDALNAGEDALRAGSVGAVLVAGGQGSRLGFDGPKGSYSIAPVSGATLFEIHARKILALEKRYSSEIPFYIMTSRANDADTRSFFEENDFFGLDGNRVKFFCQGMWPGLWEDGRIVLESPCEIFMSPDGHGGTLTALKDRGMLADMKERGVDTLFYFQVDNPLVEIADPAFVGFHRKNGADISVKVCAKRDASEGIGVVVVRDGRNAVVEYTELTDQQKNERLPDGELKFRYGSVAIHIFSREFLEREADAGLPLHVAHKKVPYCSESGETVVPDSPNAYKFEKFIFDVIPDAETAVNVEFARENEFSPVKNAEGDDSPATTRRDMVRKFARWFKECGVDVPVGDDGESKYLLEIDPCYALGPVDLAERLEDDFRIEGDLLLR